jgi:hypothetical protein
MSGGTVKSRLHWQNPLAASKSVLSSTSRIILLRLLSLVLLGITSLLMTRMPLVAQTLSAIVVVAIVTVSSPSVAVVKPSRSVFVVIIFLRVPLRDASVRTTVARRHESKTVQACGASGTTHVTATTAVPVPVIGVAIPLE